ncbi:MAG TPA: Rieske 2Fe-2S domain-containing protein [Anaerolineales bacterium]|nr:Rieske 2Fe-2S domain-containing protein [Anaerolineales bacterium]
MTDAVAEAPVDSGMPERVPLSRREFLNYLWAMSMVVFMAGGGGLTVWFLYPRFREGEFGGVFTVPVSELPPPDSPPKEFPEGRFWLSNIGSTLTNDPRQPTDYPLQDGIRAIYKVCTHLGCLYKWVESNDRFECPCHGSKFLQTGTRIDGPARRNLDVFPIEVLDANGDVLARTEPSLDSKEGTPVPIPDGAVSLRIDTGRRVTGAPNSAPGGGF